MFILFFFSFRNFSPIRRNYLQHKVGSLKDRGHALARYAS
jgi:hypothetical protein